MDRRIASRQPKRVPSTIADALLPSMSLYLSENDTLAQRRFNVTANKLPAKSFFMGLVEGTPYNVVINSGVTGDISLELKNVTLDETLEAVHDVYGYEFKPTSYGFEVLPPNLQTRMFNVNYLDVKRNGKSLTQVNSGTLSDIVGGFSTSSSGGTTSGTLSTNSMTNSGTPISNSSVDTRSEINFWKDLKVTLSTMVGTDKGRSVIVNPQAGVVIIHAFPAEIKSVTRYLDQIQHNLTRQVILEAKILEVELNDQFQAGVNWNLLGRINGFDGAHNPIINTDVSGGR